MRSRARDRQVGDRAARHATGSSSRTPAATTAGGPQEGRGDQRPAPRRSESPVSSRGITAGARNHALAKRSPAPNTSAAMRPRRRRRARPTDTGSGPSAGFGAAGIEAEDQHHHAAGRPRRHAGEHVGPRPEQVEQEQRHGRDQHQQPDELADLQRHHRRADARADQSDWAKRGVAPTTSSAIRAKGIAAAPLGSCGSHLIEHQIHDHAGDRNIQPQRQRPPRDARGACRTSPTTRATP